MSLLGNTSVRTILATVFLILSAGLCTALAWQLYAAWELTQSAERAATLAGADKAMLADVRSHWDPLVTRSRELAELARGGTQRDMRVIEPWYKAMSDVINGFAGLSLNLSNAV